TLGAIAILGLQYFRRKTESAIWLTATVTSLVLFSGFMPWQLAFAIQQRRAPNPDASRQIVMAFEPEAGKSRSKRRINDDDMNRRSHGIDGDLFVYVPLRIGGLPDDSVLKADLSEALLIAPDGRAESLGVGNDLEIRKEGNGDGEERVHHGIHIRGDLY